MKKIIIAALFVFSIAGTEAFAHETVKPAPSPSPVAPDKIIQALINEMLKSKPPSEKGKTPSSLPLPLASSMLKSLIGEKAPSFTATGMDGNEYNLEALRGKVIVINLWGTFCVPCIAEMPTLNEMVKKYKGKEVVFLAPATDDRQTLEGFLQKNPFKYEVLPEALSVINLFSLRKEEATATYKTTSFATVLPTHIVIDQDGIVVGHFWGFKKTTVDDLAQTIEKLLKKPATILSTKKT